MIWHDISEPIPSGLRRIWLYNRDEVVYVEKPKVERYPQEDRTGTRYRVVDEISHVCFSDPKAWALVHVPKPPMQKWVAAPEPEEGR